MEGNALKVLILAGRLNRDGARSLAGLIDRLERRGLRLQVLCLSKGSELAGDPRMVESPGLGRRWLRPWTIRRLWSEGRLERPDLLHAIHDDTIDAALALSESRELPYFQSVTGFGTLERGLRLSRNWCRGIVASSADLASELTGELGVPAERIAVVPPGIVAEQVLARETETKRVPVIGTGGPVEETSGLVVLMAAARRILDAGHDVEFLIAGHGSEQVVFAITLIGSGSSTALQWPTNE